MQRRLPGAVVADQGDALTALHPQVDVGEQCPVRRRPWKPPFTCSTSSPVETGALAKRASIFLALVGFSVVRIRSMRFSMEKARLWRASLPMKAHRCSCSAAFSSCWILACSFSILLHALLVAALLLHGVEAVVPAVELRLSVLHLDDPGNGPVQEVPVVGDGHHRAAERCGCTPPATRWRGGPDGWWARPAAGYPCPPRSDGPGSPGSSPRRRGCSKSRWRIPRYRWTGRWPPCSPPRPYRSRRSPSNLARTAHRTASGSGMRCLPPPSARQGGPSPPPGPEHPCKGRAQHILHRVPVGIHRDLGDQAHPAAAGHHLRCPTS